MRGEKGRGEVRRRDESREGGRKGGGEVGRRGGREEGREGRRQLLSLTMPQGISPP